MKKQALHYPNLRTVLMVEKVLKNAETTLSREELKEKLPRKVMHQTLNVVLEYLEESGKILDGHKGIVWIYTPKEELEALIKQGKRM